MPSGYGHLLNSDSLPLGVPALLEELQSQGISTEQIFAAAGLSLNSEFGITYRQQDLTAILGAASRLARVQETAISAGLRQKIRHFGVFGYALVTSNTFGDAFRFGGDHIDLAGAVIEVSFSREGNLGILQTRNHLMLGSNLQFIAEFWRASMTTLLSEVLGRPFPSLEMFFPYKKPAYIRSYQEAFDCKLHFDSDIMAWHFDASVLDEPCPNADPMTTQVCQDLCDQLAIDNGESRLLRSIRSVCMSRSSQTLITAETAARALGMSLRTLHRRLAEEKTSFKQLLDETRFSIATKYLRNTSISVDEISSRCGYGDVSNFRKAFQRWAGVSPSQYRKQSL